MLVKLVVRLEDLMSLCGYRTIRPQDTSASAHSGTLRHRSQDTSTPKNVVRVPWSRKSRDTSTQDNSDETQLHRWFVLNFGTDFVVPKCLGAEVSYVRLPTYPAWFLITCSTLTRDGSINSKTEITNKLSVNKLHTHNCLQSLRHFDVNYSVPQVFFYRATLCVARS